MKSYPSEGDATGLRFALVTSRFNHLISARLLEACHETLLERGAREEDVHVVWVPGAFEIPLAARALAASGRYHALAALGVVVRGGTPPLRLRVQRGHRRRARGDAGYRAAGCLWRAHHR